MPDALLRLSVGLFQGLVLISGAPLLIGLLHWGEARLQRRQGPSIFQPYRDLHKLLAKPAVRPAGASIVFGGTPYVLFATYGVLAFMLPIISRDTLLHGDFILVVYVLGLARFTLSLAGLDTGASFGGLGASREMFLHFLTEIGLAWLVVALAILWGTTDMTSILSNHWQLELLTFMSKPELVVLGLAFFLLVLLEAERLPVDNPATHLELTMSQRAVTLEFAGRDLALVEWAEAIKLVALITLAGHLFVPLPFAQYLSPLASGPFTIVLSALGYVLRIGLLLLGLTLWENSQPKRRLRNVPRMALISVALSATAILYALTFTSVRGTVP